MMNQPDHCLNTLSSPLHAVWAAEAGAGVTTALMNTLAIAIASGQVLAEAVWVVLPQQALVSPWQQAWQAIAQQHGIASSLGVRVVTQFEWQLHWLNQYFMLATPLATLLAEKLSIAWQPSHTTTWQVLQSRWETVGQGSLVWLLKTAPLLASLPEDSFTQADWLTLLESCLTPTPLPEKLAQFVPTALLTDLKAWLFEQTVAQGWLPKPWIAPLYEGLLAHLKTLHATNSGITQQVKLLIIDEAHQVPLQELHPLLSAVGFQETPVWLGVKIDPLSLEAAEESGETTVYTQAQPPVLTALQQWGWSYTLIDDWQHDAIRPRIVTPIQTALVKLLTEAPAQPNHPKAQAISRFSFSAEASLNDWVKSATAHWLAEGKSVGVLVPSTSLKAQWQAQLLSAYAPLEAQWMRWLTLCLAGWQLATQGSLLAKDIPLPWQENSQNQPLLQSWLWVEYPEWSEALQQWQTDVVEAIQPFCTQAQWQAFWQNQVNCLWQTGVSPSQWVQAWVKALFPLITQRHAGFHWQRLYLPLLNELQSVEQRLGLQAMQATQDQLLPWLEGFFLPWMLPAKQSSAREESANLPTVLTYTQAVGHCFDVVICPYWHQLPDVRSIQEGIGGAFDAPLSEPAGAIEQWLPKTVINEVLGAWATATQELILLEYSPATDANDLLMVQEASSKSVFLKQQLAVPVLESALGIHPQTPPQWETEPSTLPDELTLFSERLPFASPTVPLLQSAEKPLYLSVSGLEEYLKCPKRFYYSRVLRLPSDPSDALLKGNLIHLIMEHFNLQATPETHTVEHLVAIADQLLSVETHRHAPPVASILENETYQAYVKLPRLLRFQLKQECLAGFDNLRLQGYFSKPITHVQPELDLPDVELKGLAGVRFKMMLDAVLHHPDGSLTLVDYKAYSGTRYVTSLAKSLEHLQSVLTPLPPLEAGETGFAKAVMEHRHYQLALYAYGLQDVSMVDAHQRLGRVGLQLVRPQKEATKFETGSIGLYLDATSILDAREAVLESLQGAVVDRLKNDNQFLPNAAGGYCDTCSFSAICPATQANASDEEG